MALFVKCEQGENVNEYVEAITVMVVLTVKIMLLHCKYHILIMLAAVGHGKNDKITQHNFFKIPMINSS